MTEPPTLRSCIKHLKALDQTPEVKESIRTMQAFVRHQNNNKADMILVCLNVKKWKLYQKYVMNNGK